MKKYTHIIIALMFIPMAAYAGGAMLMQIGGGVADVGGVAYKALFKLEQVYDTNKILNEVDSQNYGIISGNVAFTTGSGGHTGEAAQFDGDTDYITISDTELSTIGVSGWESGHIEFAFKSSGGTQRSHIFYQFISGDGPRLEWRASDVDWQFILYENSSIVISERFSGVSSGTPSTSVYYCYRIEWTANPATVTFYKSSDNTFGNWVELTKEAGGTYTDDVDAIVASGFAISHNHATQACYGFIDEFYIY